MLCKFILLLIFLNLIYCEDKKKDWQSPETPGYFYILYRQWNPPTINCNGSVYLQSRPTDTCTYLSERPLIFNADTKVPITTDTITQKINLDCLCPDKSIPSSTYWERESFVNQVISYPPKNTEIFKTSKESLDGFIRYKPLSADQYSNNENLFCIVTCSNKSWDYIFQPIKVRVP